MSNSVVAFIASLGAAAWIYNRFMNTTGGNTKSSLTTAAVSGVSIFIFLLLLLSMLSGMIE